MGWKATGRPTRPQAARQVGGARRRHRHRDGQAPTATAGHLRVAASPRCGRSFDARSTTTSTERRTVRWLVRRYVAGAPTSRSSRRSSTRGRSRTSRAGLGAIRLARLDREDVADVDREARGRRQALAPERADLSHVLRAALAEAVEEGLIARSPAARVSGCPAPSRSPSKVKETDAWDAPRRSKRFLEVDRLSTGGRSGSGWACSTGSAEARSSRSAGTTSTSTAKTRADRREPRRDQPRRSVGRREERRSRRLVPLDDETLRVSSAPARRASDRTPLAGAEWEDNDLIIATRAGRLVLPRSYDRALALIVEQGRAAPPHVPRSAPHRGDAHGQQRQGHRRAPRDRRHPRPQPRDADERVRARASPEPECGCRGDRTSVVVAEISVPLATTRPRSSAHAAGCAVRTSSCGLLRNAEHRTDLRP